MASPSCTSPVKYYEHSLLFDLNWLPCEGLSNKGKVFAGCINGNHYITNSHDLFIFDQNNASLLETSVEEEIIGIHELPELDSAFIKCRDDNLKVVIFGSLIIDQFLVKLHNLEDVKVKSWPNGFLEVIVLTSDSRQIILSEITKQSFLDAVLSNDTEFFAQKLQKASIQKCHTPLSLFCLTSSSKIAVAISLRPHLKVLAFENSMSNLISEQDVLHFSHPLEPGSSFVKSEYLGSGYFAVLTVQHKLLIFNAIARVCCGALYEASTIFDFAIKLRRESGAPLTFDLYTLHECSGNVFLEVRSYPGLNLCLSLPLTTTLSSLITRKDLNLEPLMLEQLETSLKVSTFIVKEPLEQLKTLVMAKKFIEAHQFAVKYELSSKLIAKFEFVASLNSMIGQAEKLAISETDEDSSDMLITESHSTCCRTIELLSEIEVLEPSSEILLFASQGVIPRIESQSQLLEQILLKLPQNDECRGVVAAFFKRLQAFRKLEKYRDLCYIAWRKFASAKISEEFVECFMNWENYYDGFLLWSMFRDDLTADLTKSSVGYFFSLLSRKPPIVTCDNAGASSRMAEVENKLHAWLASDLLPALLSNCPSALPLLAEWLVNRVHQLEHCLKNGCTQTHLRWPETAIIWIEEVLRKSEPPSHRLEDVTPKEEVNYLISGLCSRSSEVDPFHPLRTLLFNLKSIRDLHSRYNFKLDLKNCAMDAKSVAFKLMDIAVSSHSSSTANNTATMERIDSFMKERGLNADSAYSEYCTSFFSTFKPSNPLQSFKVEEKSPLPPSSPPAPPIATIETANVADLSWRACFVASRIKSLDYRYKMAQLLAKVTPTPWPQQLHVIVDSVLADCSRGRFEDVHPALHRLTRRSNLAKATDILLKYKVELDNRLLSGPARSISSLLLHASSPWLNAPSSNPPSSLALERPRSEILSDALSVANFLTTSTSPSTLVALTHLRLALHQVLTLPPNAERYSVNTHQRVDYIRSTVLTEVMKLERGGRSCSQAFVELIFREAICELANLWELTKCGFEQASLYLEVFSCIALEATKLCSTANSPVAKEASHWLRYCHLGYRILSHFEIYGISLSHFPKPDETVLHLVLLHSHDMSPFDVHIVALFHHLLQWNTQTLNMSAVDKEILLVDTWVTSDHPRTLETIVGIMRHLVERGLVSSRGPFEKWQFSLLYDDEIFERVDLDTAHFIYSDSLQWLSQLLEFIKPHDAEISPEVLSEGLRLATDYAVRLNLITSVSIPLIGSLTSLCYDSVRAANISLRRDSQATIQQNDLLDQVERVLVEQVDSWMGDALDNLFRGSSNLDVPLAFGLAMCSTLANSASRMQAIVANNPRASNKVQIIAGMMFKASSLLRTESSEKMIRMARGLAMNAKWDAALRVYGLRHSHRDPRPDLVLRHLIEILPQACRTTGVTDPASVPAKPLPSVGEIVDFCEDFRQDVGEALLKHLEILITTPFSGRPTSPEHVDDEMKVFEQYSKAKTERASAVFNVLLQNTSADSHFLEDRLVPSIKRLFASSSPYDYEQLNFLLNCIRTLDDIETVTKMERLLEFLQRYHLKSSRRAQSNLNSGAVPLQEASHITNPPAAISYESIPERHRLPFHPLCIQEGFKFFEKEINQSNMHKWLNLDKIMEWDLSDNIRIAVVSNGLSSLEKSGLLRIQPRSAFLSANLGASRFFRHVVRVDRAAADIWEHASACEHIFRAYFTRAFKILARVQNREALLTFLGEAFSSFRDGPIKVLFLDMVVPLLSRWLGVGGKDSASHSHSSLSSNERSGSSSVTTAPRLSDRIREDAVLLATQKALEEAEVCLQKLAVETCLHRYSITRFWPDILARGASSSVLVDLLLDKACTIYASPPLIGASRVDPAVGQVVTYHRREEVLAKLRCALKDLLSLQGVSFANWARQVVWQRMALPKSIRPTEWPETNPPAGTAAIDGSSEGVDLNATAIVFDLDSSVLMPGEQADLSLNATFVSPDNRYNLDGGTRARGLSEPKERDFVLAEFLITSGNGEDLKHEVNRALAEWCLLRPLSSAVLRSLSTYEVRRRWRTVRLTLRCQKMPSEEECLVSTLIEYLRCLAVRARQK
ncbi:hypothetical protein Aperf_G00000094217 [Anoplocephala perfoliata]